LLTGLSSEFPENSEADTPAKKELVQDSVHRSVASVNQSENSGPRMTQITQITRISRIEIDDLHLIRVIRAHP